MYKLCIKNNKLYVSENSKEYDSRIYLKVEEENVELECFGIYGQINFNNSKNLVVVTKATSIGDYAGKQVYEIKGVHLISLIDDKDNFKVKMLINKFFKMPGLYFSQGNIHISKLNRLPNHFLFNEIPIKMLHNSLNGLNDNYWPVVNCIQGYFYKYKSLTLIARRAPGRSGTRYFSRGCNERGDCSNFVEIEQIFKDNSYSQVRGSIPFKWKQIVGYRYNPPFTIPQQSDDFFLKSSEKITELYGKNILYLNLINNEGRESNMFKTFNYFLKNSNFDFINFNFKNEIAKTP